MRTPNWIFPVTLLFIYQISLFPATLGNRKGRINKPQRAEIHTEDPTTGNHSLKYFIQGKLVKNVVITRKPALAFDTSLREISTPKIIPLSAEPKFAIPGEGGFAPPRVVKAIGKKIPVRFGQPVKAPSLIMKDASQGEVLYLNLNQEPLTSYINCIEKDSEGYVWFGLGDGIIRYSGSQFIHFGIENNFPLGMVYDVLSDKKGTLWFGGVNGICQYDGNNFIYYNTTGGLNHNHVRDLMLDRNGNLWIGTEGGGLAMFDGFTFTHYATGQGLLDDRIRYILEDSNGKIWIGTRSGGVSEFDGHRFLNFTNEVGLPTDNIRSILEDQDQNLWFGSNGMGLTRFDGHNFYYYATSEIGFDGFGIKDLLKDNLGNVWIGTRNSGVLNYKNESFAKIGGSEGLIDSWTTSFMEDASSNIWVGTYGHGVYKILRNHFFQIDLPFEKEENWVQSILSDEQNQLWFATANNLVMYDGNQTYQFKPSQLHFDALSLCKDRSGDIWIGTKDRGVYRYDGKDFFHYSREVGLDNNYIRSIVEDRKGQMWFGTWEGGITCLHVNEFTTYTKEDGLSDNRVWSLAEGPEGAIWIGTVAGVDRFDGENFTRFNADNGFTGHNVFSMLLDSQGTMWLGSSNGLSYYDGQKFTNVHQTNGMKGYAVMSITEDIQNNLWLGTTNGIQLVVQNSGNDHVRSNFKIYNFDQSDGLKRRDFEANSAAMDANGNLWWGSIEGLTFLDINKFKIPNQPPKVQLNHIEIEQHAIDFRSLSDSSYRNSFEFGRSLYNCFDSIVNFENYPLSLYLPHDIKDLTFYFSAIDWQGSEKLRYSYFMEDLDKSWSPFRRENSARYNSLPPGEHVFKIRAIGAAQIVSEPFEYHFSIGLPWWSTWWAYGIYLLSISGLIYFIHFFLINRKINQMEILRLKELDEVKSRFYTNITHEFRTPLTVIQGLADKIKGHPSIKKAIERNSANLLNLINQIINLAKLDSGKIGINMRKSDVISFLKYIVESHESLAKRKKIKLRFTSASDFLQIDHDPDILLKIFSNLISNAIKFSSIGQVVHIIVYEQNRAKKHTLGKSLFKNEALVVQVKDNGIGIAQDELEHVFDRFYQGRDQQIKEQGSGIGLAYVKELVELLHGKILVESEINVGTNFTVFLPITRNAPLTKVKRTMNLPTEVPISVGVTDEELTPILDKDSRNPVILIVEDNPDVKNYLSLCLAAHRYQKYFAENGQQGCELAIDTIPDLIISDVMMPRKDGFQLCRELKNDFRTSHIPIILLTAKVDVDSKLEGLGCGADAYLAKPFNEQELLIRIKQLITNRKRLQQRHQEARSHRFLTIPESTNKEDSFMLKVQEAILDHVEEENFSLERFSKIMGMSVSQLYRKINALTGKSIGTYIRSIRLYQARELLLTTNKKVSEIAYDVGFKDPAYFSRSFSEEFGMSPRRFRLNSKEIKGETLI